MVGEAGRSPGEVNTAGVSHRMNLRLPEENLHFQPGKRL